MTQGSISKALLAVSIVAGTAGAAVSAQAGSSGGNLTAGSGFPQYTYEADAIRLCKGDTVVWGSGAHKGIYYVKGSGPYTATGQRIAGFYACMADVKKKGYKIE
jgi:plastocyanin